MIKPKKTKAIRGALVLGLVNWTMCCTNTSMENMTAEILKDQQYELTASGCCASYKARNQTPPMSNDRGRETLSVSTKEPNTPPYQDGLLGLIIPRINPTKGLLKGF